MNTTTPRKTLNENTLFCSEFRGRFRARAVFKGFRPLRRDNIWRCRRTLLTNTIAAQQQTKPNWFSNETKLGFTLLLTRGQQVKSTNFQTARAEPLFYLVYLLLEHALVCARSWEYLPKANDAKLNVKTQVTCLLSWCTASPSLLFPL